MMASIAILSAPHVAALIAREGSADQDYAEVIARIHNGGPKGASKKATDGYWQRVLTQLRKQRAE